MRLKRCTEHCINSEQNMSGKTQETSKRKKIKVAQKRRRKYLRKHRLRNSEEDLENWTLKSEQDKMEILTQA